MTVFDRIDTPIERAAAVATVCGEHLDPRSREALASAITEYDRRRWRAHMTDSKTHQRMTDVTR